MTINTIIKSLMKTKRISQKELGQMIGLSQQTIQYKLTAPGITFVNVVKMLDALGYEVVIQPKPEDKKVAESFLVTLEDEMSSV